MRSWSRKLTRSIKSTRAKVYPQIFLILFSYLIFACTSSNLQQTTLEPATNTFSVIDLTTKPSKTIMPSNMPTHTNTPIPTLTSTSTISPTSTKSLPFLQGTILPELSQVINLQNLSDLQEIARWGKGAIEDIEWSPDGKFIALATTLGIYIYDSQKFEEVDFTETKYPSYDLDFSPDGSIIAAAEWDIFEKGAVEGWSLLNGELKKRVRTIPSYICL